ncbi:MAG: FeoC-like transcriptional regulator [Alkalispirochaeta sp.]
MIVSAVKKELQSRHRATISQLAAELGESPQRVAAALQLHVERGRAFREVLVPEGGCAVTQCAHCPLVGACRVDDTPTTGVEVFVWNKAGSDE